MYSPQFTITNSILKNIGQIDAAKALIDASPLLPSWERKFREDAVARAVHHGTHLEGNELNFTEARRVIEGEKVTARERDVQEVINYRNVIDYIGKIKTPPDEELLKKLHKLTTENILPADEAGCYREKPVVVRNSRTGEVTFRPPPAVEVPYLIQAFLSWLNSEEESGQLHPVLRAGIAQYELVRIHPFTDGNGRVARSFCTLLLYQAGYDIRRFFSLEEYYDKNAKAYYESLQSVAKTEKADHTRKGQGYESTLSRGLENSADKHKVKTNPSPNFHAVSQGKISPTPKNNMANVPEKGYRVALTNQEAFDLTPWLDYFTEGLALEFLRIKQKVARLSRDLSFQNTLGGQVYLSDRQLKIIEHIQTAGFIQNKNFSTLFPDLSDDTILRELKDLMDKRIIKKKGKTKAARYILA